MELHSPRKRDSGGIHLTGRRAFTKKRRKLLEINQCNEQAIMNVLPYPINIETDKTKIIYWSILPLMGALKDLSENATCDVRI